MQKLRDTRLFGEYTKVVFSISYCQKTLLSCPFVRLFEQSWELVSWHASKTLGDLVANGLDERTRFSLCHFRKIYLIGLSRKKNGLAIEVL
jgi:hypothetical protein